MKPTRAHYFFARNWLGWIWIALVPSVCVLIMACALGPPPQLAGFAPEAKSYLFLLGIASFIGLCFAALLGPFILGPLYHHREILNGGPFKVGDRVEILVGRNRGHIATVSEVWDWRGSLGVVFADAVPSSEKTIYRVVQVIRADDR